MIHQTIRHAVEHQERLRREAITDHRVRRARARSRGIAAAIAAIIGTLFAEPVPLGSVLPATH